jgi:arabinofuranosyltransferase
MDLRGICGRAYIRRRRMTKQKSPSAVADAARPSAGNAEVPADPPAHKRSPTTRSHRRVENRANRLLPPDQYYRRPSRLSRLRAQTPWMKLELTGTIRPMPAADAPTGKSRPWMAALPPLLISLLVLAIHARTYLPFFSDDALISLQYARRLLQGHGLTWTDGPRVEGYTNLLWILCCGGLGALGFNLITVARTLGVLGMGATVAAVVIAAWPRRLRHSAGALAGGLGLALAGPVAVWAIGGLEQPLLAALLAWATVLCYPLLEANQPKPRQALLPGLLLGLACLTRADAPVLCVALGIGLLAAIGINRSSLVTLVRLAALPLLFTVGQLVFRLAYYGQWVPNSALAKVAFTRERLAMGVGYLLDSTLYLSGLWLAAAAAILFVQTPRRQVRLLFVALLIWSAYVALVGGDTFPARRQLLPTVIWAALLFSLLVRWIAAERRFFRGAPWVATTALLALLAAFQWKDPQNRRAIEERWEWDGQVVGNLLREAFGPAQPLLACDAAGCLPYFSQLPALDMLGLNDRQIAQSRPPTFGKGPPGHDLGNGEYVLSREPDLVAFGVPSPGWARPMYPTGLQMRNDPRFTRLYRPLYFHGTDPYPVTTQIWVRLDSDKIGIERQATRVTVPGYFLATSEEVAAQLAAPGCLETVIPPGHTIYFSKFPLAPGDWRLSAQTDGTVRITLSHFPEPTVHGFDTIRFSCPDQLSTSVDIELTAPPGATVHVRRLAFARIAD